MSSASSPPRIFVQITSYRDAQCQWTVKDLFEKAAHPERVFVGICWQYAPEEDGDCFVIAPPRPEQVRAIQYHIRDAQGAGWARKEAQSLWQGEEYILQIQSHMRFEPGWDEALLDMLAGAGAEKAVLSTYLPPYIPPHKLSRRLLCARVRRFGKEGDPQVLHLSGIPVDLSDKDRKGLYPSPFWIGNFMFGPSEVFAQVPHDPHIYFFGEELAYSARLWTHGWDIFQPDRCVVYHQWDRSETFGKQGYRKTSDARNQQSRQRIMHLLGFESCDNAAALAEIDAYGLGEARKLVDLWAFAGIDWQQHSITQNAKEGRWDMKARGKAAAITTPKAKKPAAKKAAKRPRIFVQIASYRDPDCQHTVKDLFEKAAHPERIFVGICWQFVKEEDARCFELAYPRPKQVRVHEVDAKAGKGVCWARGLTQKLWQGEEFTLQIDSHMRFEPGWDETLLEVWQACGNAKAVLTCYPPGFTPPDTFERSWIFGMAAREFDQNDIFLMHGKPAYAALNPPEKPIVGAFASACMLFGPGSIIEDVPYDPHLYFFGEEITLAVRLWTHGYDLFHPNRLIIYHDWNRDKRPTHFSDHTDWTKLNERSFARVHHLLGTAHSSNAEITRELDRYGLGTARPLAEYQRYSGVNFSVKTISAEALRGEFKPYKREQPQGEKLRIFVQIASYRDRECQWTVKDLFEKAVHPERIFVGICWQFDAEEDKDCFEISVRPEQVRIVPVDWREGEGVCWARHQTQMLWEGEEYTLQVDAHMRFVPGWDELMIAELAACEAPKPIISCNPASYMPPDKLERNPKPSIRRVSEFMADGNLRCKGELLDRSPEKPLNAAFIAAGFIFTRSEVITQVPYDPYLYFDQEEVVYAAQLYTRGWDIFSSRHPLVYHYYNTDLAKSVRPLHSRDLWPVDKQKTLFLRDRGLRRFNHLMGYELSGDPEVLKELDIYGLGTVRSLKQYEEYCGVDFKHKTVSEKALRCHFIKDLAKYRAHPIYIPEIDGPKPQPAQEEMPAPLPAQPPLSVPPQVLKPLEIGDFVPYFEMLDTGGKFRAIETLAGRHMMLFFLPASNHDFLLRFFDYLQLQLSNELEIWQLFVLDDTLENLTRLKERFSIPHVLFCDPEQRLARAFGLLKSGEKAIPPTGYVLSPNLKIMHIQHQQNPQKLAAKLAEDCKRALTLQQDKKRGQRVISETTPVLIVPEVFTPEFCRKCVQAFKNGHTFDGTVGAEDKLAYRPNAKVRTDHIVENPLLEEIDEKLSRSLFPELKKVFGFEVAHRELYKIGLYSGEKGGFFRQHRDNFDSPLGYRRIAMTLHLSDDYEGGGLRFPEYDDHIYRPTLGSAIAFSGSTLHEARPVTKGERFVLVGFLHGDEEEAFRRQQLAAKGAPLKISQYQPALRSYPELRQSRDFFKQWRERNVSFDAKPAIKTGSEGLVKQGVMINTLGTHQPKKIFESKEAIIFDDFLPEDIYQKVNDFALKTDYEYINTKGKIARAWHVQDGFPLRSALNLFYYANDKEKPVGDYVYPTKTDLDIFTDHLLAAQPQVQHMIGAKGADWAHVSVTAWIYPHGTGLSMHDDGAGVYSGAYVYFLNPTWRPHWGGLLLLIDEEGNRRIREHQNRSEPMEFYKRKWLHANNTDEVAMEHGFAQCVFPKRNRMVFIANDAYHMVTRVNEQAGDNLRMSLAGFFNRKK